MTFFPNKNIFHHCQVTALFVIFIMTSQRHGKNGATHKQNDIDHIWSNKPEHIAIVTTKDIYISDYLPIFGVRLYKRKRNENTKRHRYIVYRHYKNLDKNKFIQTLEDTPWDLAFVFDDTEDVFDTWYKLLNDVIDANALLK